MWEHPPTRILTGALVLVLVVGLLVVATRDSGTQNPAEVAEAPMPRSHPFEEHLDEFGISRVGAPTGDFDGEGNSFPAEALAAAGWRPGVPVTVLGTQMRLPDYGPGRPDHLISDGQRVSVPGDLYSSMTFLTTATRTDGAPTGAQGRGRIVYTDRSEDTFDVEVPDWNEGPAGDAALNLPYANAEDQEEPSQIGAVRMYARTVPVDPDREVAHVVLPRVHDESARMHVFAMGGRSADHPWTATWGRSTSSYVEVGPWEDQTVRLAARTTTGGSNVRIRLANTFAHESVRIGAASIALRDEGAGVRGATVPLEFGGESETAVPAGGQVFSDPVEITLPPHSDIAVSLYLPEEVSSAPVHYAAVDTNYATVAGGGDRTRDTSGAPFTERLYQWPFLTGVEVMEGPGAIVTLGDSITDGVRTTRDAHARWPDALSRRLAAQEGVPNPGVVNAGIGGNHVVSDGYPGEGVSRNSTGVALTHRAPRDAYSQAGAETLVVWAGINDLRWGTGPAEVVEGLNAVGHRAREHGMRVFVATLGPCRGELRCTDEVERGRQYVNSWIRDQGRDPDSVFDAVWDFDRVLRDPEEPRRLLPEYDSGDHLHPGDAGMEALAESVNLAQLIG
ncbi:GDSL-type esterase/lipase family protein [Nocardiopsis kunsanensis]|uniref:GDSL-type esterase/lipase family protein n=1 Tax=Nocardiopsis kunsanensis TaxID=141693 RepID=UPI000687A526|nr:GDSL-type esterase/lipase family protein [Nocardiopsis kunsanensis]